MTGMMPGISARESAMGLGDIVAFKDVRLVYRAAISDSDNCSFTNGSPAEFCASDATWEGGAEHLIRSFSGVVKSVVPITIKDALKTPGKGTGKASESAVRPSAANTYSSAQDGPGDCTGMAGTNTEAYAKTSTTGSLTVDGLTAVRDRQGSIVDFNLSLRQFNESGPGENVKVTDNVTAADQSSCVGKFTNSFTELFGTGDIDIVHDELGLLNETTGEVKLSHWTLNLKWHAHDDGLLAAKTVTGTGRFQAPDSGPMHLHETLQIYAAGAICFLVVHKPHESHHNPGHVNVQAAVGCERKVAGLKLHVHLLRDGIEVSSRAFTSHDTLVLDGSAAERCTGGQHHYRGSAEATATTPGYMPGTWTKHKKGATVVIRC